jgi:hypothetical protein
MEIATLQRIRCGQVSIWSSLPAGKNQFGLVSAPFQEVQAFPNIIIPRPAEFSSVRRAKGAELHVDSCSNCLLGNRPDLFNPALYFNTQPMSPLSSRYGESP